jgi:hypothetical protein
MNTLWVEACCLWQCARFSLRHPRYFVIFVSIWGPSLLAWRKRRVVRVAFVTLQWIDDLLDGDRKSKREPLEIVDELLAGNSRHPLARLMAALFADLDAETQSELIALVREMRRDRVRMLARETWSESELDEHHRKTFNLSVDLLLRVTGCRARAGEVGPLVDALAWCSVFRDLDEDQRKGLNNIPHEVEFEAWSRARHEQAKIALRESARAIASLEDPQARRILGVFQKSIERFAAGLAIREIAARD